MDRDRGFTLVEVVASTLIIAVLAGGMFSAFVAAYNLFNRARHRILVFNFAREALDRLRSGYQYADSSMSVADGHTEDEIGTILEGELVTFGGALTYDVTEPELDGYKKVVVRVNWNEPTL